MYIWLDNILSCKTAINHGTDIGVQHIWQHFSPNFSSLSGSLFKAASVFLHGKNMQSCQAAADLPNKLLPSILNCVRPVHFWTSLGRITLELLLGSLMELQRTDSINLENQNKAQKTLPKNMQIEGFFNSHKLHLMSVGKNDFGLELVQKLTVT